MANEKDFQELTLTQANPTGSMVSPPGYISISGNFGAGTVTITLTGDTVPISISSLEPVAFANPVTGALAFPVQAARLTFTASGGAATALSVKWYPVRVPY